MTEKTVDDFNAEIDQIRKEIQNKVSQILADGNIEIGKRLGKIEDLEAKAKTK